MFFLPWLHYGESMIDFEKSTFFHREAIFHSVRELPRAIFDIKSVDAENSPLAPCLQGEKLHHSEKCRFFKVRDTFTMM